MPLPYDERTYDCGGLRAGDVGKTVLLATVILLAGPLAADAASHHEITVIPTGPAHVEKGSQEVSYRLPTGQDGVLPQSLVVLAAQPWRLIAPAPLRPEGYPFVDVETKEQVPATIKFVVGGQELPLWELTKHPTAYVINLDTIKANPQYAENRIAMKVEADTAADGVNVAMLGMPDPLLLDSSTNGPLSSLADAAGDPDVKAYFRALVTEIAGDKEAARAEYRKLRANQNDRVGRFARRGLRMLAYDLRERKLSGNLMEHYRWGLYLQQCGLLSAAFTEFEECRILFPPHGDSQFRAGETLDLMGGPMHTLLDYMDRTGEASTITSPTVWYTLVVILQSRDGKTLSAAEVATIKDCWQVVTEQVWAASDGAVPFNVSFLDVEDEQQQPYRMYEDEYYAPTDDIVQVRGWFDSVVSVVPRLPGEAGKPGRTFGGDVGPNGAVLSCLFHDARWDDYLKAWYDQMTWAANVSGIVRVVPFAEQAISCGQQPARDDGYAYRAALRYHCTRAMLHRLKVTDIPVPDSYLQVWRVEGPYPVDEAPPADGVPGRHALDPIPAGPAPQVVNVVSEESFIDLTSLFPDAGWTRAQATSWVYSPTDQEVRMWLGQNDGMAVWMNGQCLFDGRYYSAGKYEDKNLPDTLACHASLRQGWNELRVVVESWPPPRDRGWGFSVRLCTWDNKPVPGLACVNRQPDKDLAPRYASPDIGPYYSWEAVRPNWQDALPELGAADLQSITAVQGLHVVGDAEKPGGYMAITAPGRPASPTYRSLTKAWQPGIDRDIVLNNVLDWAREACAAFRYAKDGKDHDLLVLKPEAIGAYLTLLDEPTSAAELFGGRAAAERVLGYVTIPAGPSTLALLVVDTLLSDKDDTERAAWPVDEEDLLTPFGKHIPNAALMPVGPPAPRQASEE
ncbi:MAG: hypothetical protein JXQ75_03895 [Phycisphaerae bacterium]|nr:hypothetical protein [Phycisphaerae bacterium]